MNKKKFKKFCDKKLCWWSRNLGLSAWRIRWFYVDKLKSTKKGRLTEARVVVTWEYKNADILINYKILKNKTKKYIEGTLVHELTHAIVNEMQEKKNRCKHEERVVTDLTNAFIWVRNETRRDVSNG